MKLEQCVDELLTYIKNEEFSGWDPYDGLNSLIAKKIGLKKFSFLRLLLIQSFKRNPINLRRLFMVPKGQNPKGIALCLNAICNIYNCNEKILKSINISKEECVELISELGNKLISISENGYSGTCWGYDFDWQARLLFLFPKGTPNVVCTAYAVESLINAYEISKNELFLEHAISSSDFILKDLNKKYFENGFIFSYSPLDGNNTVYNASFLGAKTLAYCYKYSGKEIYKKNALDAISHCIDMQNKDGSWFYGGLDVQKWIDSFHTAYNLEALNACKNIFSTSDFDHSMDKGFDFYINNFFLEDGTPKYYHDKIYPIDIHSPAQLMVLLCKFNKIFEYESIMKKVFDWTNNNMRSEKGYYFYQKHKFFTNKISYFRWSQAFMLNALTSYLKKINEN